MVGQCINCSEYVEMQHRNDLQWGILEGIKRGLWDPSFHGLFWPPEIIRKICFKDIDFLCNQVMLVCYLTEK